jgi:hypothetical protein
MPAQAQSSQGPRRVGEKLLARPLVYRALSSGLRLRFQFEANAANIRIRPGLDLVRENHTLTLRSFGPEYRIDRRGIFSVDVDIPPYLLSPAAYAVGTLLVSQAMTMTTSSFVTTPFVRV